jgi:hypothetical protein
MATFVTVLFDELPSNARKLVDVEYSCDWKGDEISAHETLWFDEDERKFILENHSCSLFLEYDIIDILNWLDDVSSLDPHLYNCYGIELLNLIEDIEMLAGVNR